MRAVTPTCRWAHADMKSNMHTTYAFFVDAEADPKDLKRLVNEVLEENRSKKKGKTELRLKALAGKAAGTVCVLSPRARQASCSRSSSW